ncbi:hypothetical protein OHS59_01405 [Streptomyces sp. NBC_00414]|uniref:hypothetical protein n=1 Tax=Streptomyces sp. NBC_00414 TaxID=2975739 RepID=UPI002E1C6DB1
MNDALRARAVQRADSLAARLLEGTSSPTPTDPAAGTTRPAEASFFLLLPAEAGTRRVQLVRTQDGSANAPAAARKQ